MLALRRATAVCKVATKRQFTSSNGARAAAGGSHDHHDHEHHDHPVSDWFENLLYPTLIL